MKRVQLETDDGELTALLSQEHKILLPLKGQEPVHPECRPIFTVQSTTYDDLKVITKEQTIANVASIAQHMSPFNWSKVSGTLLQVLAEGYVKWDSMDYHLQNCPHSTRTR